MCTNKILFIVLLIGAVMSGCVSSKAPTGWLPKIDALEKSLHGGWLYVEFVTDLSKYGTFKLKMVHNENLNEEIGYETDFNEREFRDKLMYAQGEFIASDSSNIYILQFYGKILKIKKNEITFASLELYQKNVGDMSVWAVLGTISTISNGWWLAFTAPVWMITGTGAASSESHRDYYHQEYPRNDFWKSNNRFSRFPQGLPPNIDINTIK